MAILRLDTGCNAYIPHIHIGREAENDVSQIDFVVQSWIDTYGDGGVSLAVQRYGDKEAYIVPLAIVDGVATWTISDTDTAKEGRGSVQLTYVVGEKVKKSQIYKIVVDSSLVGSDAVPDPYDNWLAILTEMTAQTGANADSTRVSAQEAAKSEANAKASETNAKASETNAKASEEASAQSATSASASAVNASADAQRAETAEANAEESAANAKADADSAKADADRAEQAAATATAKAQEATQDAQTANTASQTATAKASEASASASTASTAATTATTKAQAASESATTAQTAQTSAQTAQGLAEQAQTAAETAQGAAESARDEAQEIVDGITGKVEQIDSNTEKIESLEDDRYKPYAVDTASGAVASFPDGADGIPLKSCIVQIEPVHDLHGYDHPWSGGGGENILDQNIKFTTQTVRGVTLTTTDGYNFSISGTGESGSGNIQTNTIPVADCIVYPAGTYTVTGMIIDTYHTDGSWYSNRGGTFTSPEDFIIRNGYREIAIGTTYNVNEFISMTKGTTALIAWTPYSNICPITGWTGANVTRTGKNLFPNKTCQWSENKLIIGDDQLREGIFLKQGTYTVSARRSKGKIFCKTSSGSNITLIPNASALSGTLTVAKDDYYRFWIYDSSGFTASDVEWFQLEFGSTATDYEPYQSTTYDITFPTESGTVYGGQLNVTTGELVVDRVMVDLPSDMSWDTWGINHKTSGITGFYIYRNSMPSTLDFSNIGKAVLTNLLAINNNVWGGSEVGYKTNTRGASLTWYEIVSINNETASILSTDTYAEAIEKFKAFLESTPLNVLYELATPITYHLTPQEITTLLGQNNIWADTGDVSVEYRADVTKYINKKITEAVSALT